MQIIFSNGTTIDLFLDDTPLAAFYQQSYKHLQNITVPFKDWDSPFYYNQSLPQLVDKLTMYAQKINVKIDQERSLSQDQDYFNSLHIVYENNWSKGPDWADFHRHLHMCEKNYVNETVSHNTLKIDYYEKAGLLEKPIDAQWLKHAKSNITAGDVFICWHELGKTPYTYWSNGEPNDIARMQQVIKPWTKLRPQIFIALENIDLQKNPKTIAEFESWWQYYSADLCRHWNISSWTSSDIFQCLVFGKVQDPDKIIMLLKNNAKPVRVLL